MQEFVSLLFQIGIADLLRYTSKFVGIQKLLLEQRHQLGLHEEVRLEGVLIEQVTRRGALRGIGKVLRDVV